MIRGYTTLGQSKVLAEILPIESADMFYTSLNHDYPWIWIDKHLMEVDDIPCWSLAALLNYFREIDFFPKIDVDEHGVTLSIDYYDEDEGKLLHPVHNIKVEAETFVGACYEMIILLHKENLI